jgi:hypothetical protein
VADPKKESFPLATARLVRRYHEVRFYLVRDAIVSKEHSPYRISECAGAALDLAEHMARGP